MRPAVLLTTNPSALVKIQTEAQVAGELELTAEPTAEPAAEPTPEPAPEPTPPYFDYTIQPGDTITAIANSFGIDPVYILWNNPEVSDDPDLLAVGETLVIPSINALIYTIKLNDTIIDIAARYDINVESVVSANDLVTPDTIGESLVILLPNAEPPSRAPAPVSAAAPAPQPAPATSSGYIWPWYGTITSYYDEWRGADIHGAIDINGAGSYGASVVAAASGQVILAAYDSYGYGYHVIIRHDDGSQTLYSHFSAIYVVEGQWVAQGEAIGALGCTGYCTGTHLHFEILIGGVPVNPLAYLP